MFLKRRLAAFAAVIAALGGGAPAALAIIPVKDPLGGSPSCPAGYSGPTNLATGCPWWLMS
jgi:hypothetical protein